MNYNPSMNKNYSPAGALETNLRAREQAKIFNAIEAAWVAEIGPGRVQKPDRRATLFDRVSKLLFGWAADARSQNSRPARAAR